MRVRRVENTKASSRPSLPRAAWAKYSSISEYRSIDPETSAMNSSGRRRMRRSVKAGISRSPSVVTIRRRVRRGSGRSPDRAGRRRRDQVSAGLHIIEAMSWRTSAASAGVSSEKSL